MRHLFIICFLTTLGYLLNAQESISEEKLVTVKLTDGSVINGEIIEWNFGETLILKTKWNPNFKIPSYRIDKVIEKSAKGKTYNFKEEGLYFTFTNSFIRANPGLRANGSNGLGFSFSAGKKINRFLLLGAGAGFDHYIWNTGEKILPVFIEAQGFFQQTNESLFYKVQIGKGFAFTDEDYGITKANGGLMIHPSLGLRIGHNRVKTTFAVGYKFQNANFIYNDRWQRRDQDITFKRLTFSIGIII